MLWRTKPTIERWKGAKGFSKCAREIPRTWRSKTNYPKTWLTVSAGCDCSCRRWAGFTIRQRGGTKSRCEWHISPNKAKQGKGWTPRKIACPPAVRLGSDTRLQTTVVTEEAIRNDRSDVNLSSNNFPETETRGAAEVLVNRPMSTKKKQLESKIRLECSQGNVCYTRGQQFVSVRISIGAAVPEQGIDVRTSI